MSDRKKELREEAKGLGIEIKGNPGEEKLEGMIADFNASKAEPVDDPEDKTEDIVEEVETSAPVVVTPVIQKVPANETQDMKHRRIMKAARKNDVATQIVKVNLTDRRENSELTSYFVNSGSIGKHIPLDVPIELENCLIIQLKKLQMPMHVEGPNGNKVTKMVKKFLVEHLNIKK